MAIVVTNTTKRKLNGKKLIMTTESTLFIKLPKSNNFVATMTSIIIIMVLLLSPVQSFSLRPMSNIMTSNIYHVKYSNRHATTLSLSMSSSALPMPLSSNNNNSGYSLGISSYRTPDLGGVSNNNNIRERSAPSVHTLLKKFIPRVAVWIKSARKYLVVTSIMLLISFTLFQDSALARSGGRMGGSFRPSPNPVYTVPRRPSPVYHLPSPPTRVPHYHTHSEPPMSGPTKIWMTGPPSKSIRGKNLSGHRLGPRNGNAARFVGVYKQSPRLSKESIAMMYYGNFAALLAIGAARYHWKYHQQAEKYRGTSSALGPGVSVVSLTVALEVPDRDDPNSILNTLKTMSKTTNTRTREGVQKLVSAVCLELLRKKNSIASAESTYKHFKDSNGSGREFHRISIENRSKFDRESMSNFGGELNIERILKEANFGNDETSSLPLSTYAVVNLTMSIEGDSTKISRITTRDDLVKALTKISTDANTEDCLLSAEVVWVPGDRYDQMTEQDVYADYPTLFPL